jgi:propionyl-CoA carboxylase alpha chain
MPGKVIELRVEVGQRVAAGEVLIVLEAMKMEHPMRAPEDGVVAELRVAAGEQVENGALLLVVETDGGSEAGGATDQGGA